MGLFSQFPWTNYHELNLDWLIKNAREVSEQAANLAEAVEQMQARIDALDIPAAARAELLRMLNRGELDALLTNTHRKHLIVGDSYATGWTRVTGLSYTPYPDYIKDLMGIDCDCVRDSGSGFTRAGDTTGKNFAQLLSSYTGDKSRITDVWFVGGYNDMNDPLQIAAGMDAAKAVIDSDFPAAVGHVCFVGNDRVSSTYVNSTGIPQWQRLKTARLAYSNAMAYQMIPHDDLTYVMHNYTNFVQSAADPVHPNGDGQMLIANILGALMRGGHRGYYKQGGVILAAPEGHAQTRLNSIGWTQQDGIIEINMPSWMSLNVSSYDAVDDQTLTISAPFAVTDDAPICGTVDGTRAYVPISGIGYTGGGTNVPTFVGYYGVLYLFAGAFQIRVRLHHNGEIWTGPIQNLNIAPWTMRIDVNAVN